jgi:DNA-directed RNA polymerase subunit M/transcription elongation factor TFIIS
MAIKRTTQTKSKVISKYKADHKWRDDDEKDCNHEITLGGDGATIRMTCPHCLRKNAEFRKIHTRDADGLV